jgi:hypothetical protein
MSKASNQAEPGAGSWIERSQHWIAVVLSALLHALLLLLAMLSSPVTVTPPQGTAAGSRMAVDFIGETPPRPRDAPPAKAAAASKPVARSSAASRVQSTEVARADDPVASVAPVASEGLATARIPQPTPQLEPPTPMPPDESDEAGQGRAPVASSPPTPPRRPRVWGQPPGMLEEDLAAENAGLARSPSTQRGYRNDIAAGQPSMEVGGYQVYYDLRSETRLRAWRDQGMTEIFLPLPGTRRFMACPLETALRRDSGPCRLLEPDSAELKAIGDGREVIDMQKVFRLGELVWSGPGPYR